ncbi:hypothetical protein GCM10025876_38510 [Demequina litorisediminis]|uniref:Ribulose-phosphate 3-epimerase n=1 Tax=Demequina litorisediminis TaxID=1849022 RepID=A0ABQ6IIB0_9MICO|nr:hypothetical protein GCM10025876_38510 [Demequina litorisediminis]
MPDMMSKVSTLRHASDAAGSHLWIQTDGGIARDTIETVARAGGDVFVAGSAVYGAADPAAEVNALRDLAAAARA